MCAASSSCFLLAYFNDLLCEMGAAPALAIFSNFIIFGYFLEIGVAISHINFFAEHDFLVRLPLVGEMAKDVWEIVVLVTIKVDALDEFIGNLTDHIDLDITLIAIFVVGKYPTIWAFR